jgi:hypothetical protein
MVMVRQLTAMSYTYTSWPRSPAIVVTQFTSTRPATEGSSGADKSCIIVESCRQSQEALDFSHALFAWALACQRGPLERLGRHRFPTSSARSSAVVAAGAIDFVRSMPWSHSYRPSLEEPLAHS